MIEKTLKKEGMIKLNGNVYLKTNEVEIQIEKVSKRFRTSHRAILPQQVTYLDREFVDCIRDEAKNLSLSLFYLYGYNEDHASTKKIIQGVHDRMRNEESCDSRLRFMQYDLSDSQRKKHRLRYENFLVNVFLDECIKLFENLH
jgi:hypothetical protein|tara:strand:+ start:374 stop:805 length:432 start_codon:yes stop_codon:yes gene_type:complete